MSDSEKLHSQEYGSWLSGLKQQIAVARQKAGLRSSSIVPQPVAQIPWGHNGICKQTQAPGTEYKLHRDAPEGCNLVRNMSYSVLKGATK